MVVLVDKIKDVQTAVKILENYSQRPILSALEYVDVLTATWVLDRSKVEWKGTAVFENKELVWRHKERRFVSRTQQEAQQEAQQEEALPFKTSRRDGRTWEMLFQALSLLDVKGDPTDENLSPEVRSALLIKNSIGGNLLEEVLRYDKWNKILTDWKNFQEVKARKVGEVVLQHLYEVTSSQLLAINRVLFFLEKISSLDEYSIEKHFFHRTTEVEEEKVRLDALKAEVGLKLDDVKAQLSVTQNEIVEVKGILKDLLKDKEVESESEQTLFDLLKRVETLEGELKKIDVLERALENEVASAFDLKSRVDVIERDLNVVKEEVDQLKERVQEVLDKEYKKQNFFSTSDSFHNTSFKQEEDLFTFNDELERLESEEDADAFKEGEVDDVAFLSEVKLLTEDVELLKEKHEDLHSKFEDLRERVEALQNKVLLLEAKVMRLEEKEEVKTQTFTEEKASFEEVKEEEVEEEVVEEEVEEEVEEKPKKKGNTIKIFLIVLGVLVVVLLLFALFL